MAETVKQYDETVNQYVEWVLWQWVLHFEGKRDMPSRPVSGYAARLYHDSLV